MSHSTRRSRRAVVHDDDDVDQDISPVIARDVPNQSRKSRRTVFSSQSSVSNATSSQCRGSNDRHTSARKNDQKQQCHINHDNNDEDDGNDENGLAALTFSSQAPELSQPIFPVRAAERNHLQNMGAEARQKAVTDLSRLVLFKALAGEPIDRLKLLKEAGLSDKKVSSAAFDESASRLTKVFGFELKRPPKFMEATLPNKFKDRYYVINTALADPDFSAKHCKELHGVHVESSVEKGLLMVILAFCFCQGEPRHDGSRWITDVDLYRLLNRVDDNIPETPPSGRTGGHKATAAMALSQASSASSRRRGGSRNDDDEDEGYDDVIATPNVDFLLEKFVYLDYLLKEKYNDSSSTTQASQHATSSPEEGSFVYSMGPRAAMEVGRRQIIYFCSEVLKEEIPDSMLQEIEDDHEELDHQDEMMES